MRIHNKQINLQNVESWGLDDLLDFKEFLDKLQPFNEQPVEIQALRELIHIEIVAQNRIKQVRLDKAEQRQTILQFYGLDGSE